MARAECFLPYNMAASIILGDVRRRELTSLPGVVKMAARRVLRLGSSRESPGRVPGGREKGGKLLN